MTRPAWTTALIAAALAGLAGIGLWRVAAALFLQIPLDPNEGWNAYHTASLMQTGGLYPPKSAYLVNNYPPLSFYAVGAVGRLTGDFITAGRLVSLGALSFIVIAMAAILRAMGAGRLTAVFPGLFFTAGVLIFSDYAGMDDPQMLGHAAAMGGLWILFAAPRKTVPLAAAAALFAISFFIKHNIVALPVACALWLLFTDRQSAFKFTGFGLLFGGAGLLAFRLAYGFSLLAAVSTARLYSTEQLLEMLQSWLWWGAIPLLGLTLLVALKPRQNAVQFLILFAGLALGLGIVFLGGAGVDANAMFEADIALSLAGGLLIASLSSWRAPLAAAALSLPFFYQAAVSQDWQQAHLSLQPVREEAAVAGKDIAFMTAQKGPALCEMLSFCYWSAKPPAVDFFNVGQAFDTGARGDQALAAAIAAKRYGVIQLDPGSDYPLGDAVHDAMAASYRLHHSDWYGSFYVPK